MSDKKYSKDLNGDSTRDEYRAASVMVYDYYPFGMLMSGRSLDTAGLCVTSFGVTEIPHFTWVNPGILSSSGGGGAVAYGQDTLINQTNGGVAASGIGGGLSYVISGITAYSIQLATYSRERRRLPPGRAPIPALPAYS